MRSRLSFTYILHMLLAPALLTFSLSASANELIMNIGGGPQLGSDPTGDSSRQTNYTLGADFNFYHYNRSERSSFVIGASYTYLATNADNNDSIHAISLYPQLSMYPTSGSWVNKLVPGDGKPFFYVRALGPTYLSDNQLGSRKQAKHFAFQAQLGVGATYRLENGTEASFAVAWKHFSNANLFDDNDGIDLPIVLTFGVRF